MQVFHFRPGQPPALGGEPGDVGGADGFYWLDIERSERDWHEKAQPWLNMRLHERHVFDTLNDAHPPYFDSTADYDLLVVHAPCPDCPLEAPATRPVAFIVSDRGLVSVRPPGDPVFGRLQERLLDGERAAPPSTAMLLYLALDQVVNALLARREATGELLSRWQERLLEPGEQIGDWRSLMQLRSQLRRFELVSENQIDVLGEWREQTRQAIDGQLEVRFNDLGEHLRRVYHYALVVQHDIDALIQIYFSSNAQRTNEILQFLAVVSAIFLPLSLVAGIFGTNFIHFPLLSAWYGPLLLMGGMIAIAAALLLWFRYRRWI